MLETQKHTVVHIVLVVINCDVAVKHYVILDVFA